MYTFFSIHECIQANLVQKNTVHYPAPLTMSHPLQGKIKLHTSTRVTHHIGITPCTPPTSPDTISKETQSQKMYPHT